MKHHVLAWMTLFCVALAALLPASAEGVYLCVGDDGHVALSDADCGPCCVSESSNAAPEPRPVWSAPPPACPPCIDVPLGNGVTARVSMATGAQQPSTAPIKAVCPADVTAPLAHGSSLVNLPEARGSALPLVRATVLLI